MVKKYRKYNFEGIVIDIPSEYDAHSGIYFDDIPDLEEKPLYTPTGKPVVSAVQDRCRHYDSEGDEADCGSCKFYQPNHPGDLIGVCVNPKTVKTQFPQGGTPL